MPADPPRRSVEALWRAQAEDAGPPGLDEIRARAERLERRVVWRDRREYVAAAICAPVFMLYVWTLPGWMAKLGSALVLFALAFIVVRMRMAAAKRAAAATTGRSVAALYLAQLVLQRDLLKSVWLWYVGPFVPGLFLIMLDAWLRTHSGGAALAALVVASVIAGVILLNRHAAAKLQAEIDTLKAQQGDI